MEDNINDEELVDETLAGSITVRTPEQMDDLEDIYERLIAFLDEELERPVVAGVRAFMEKMKLGAGVMIRSARADALGIDFITIQDESRIARAMRLTNIETLQTGGKLGEQVTV